VTKSHKTVENDNWKQCLELDVPAITGLDTSDISVSLRAMVSRCISSYTWEVAPTLSIVPIVGLVVTSAIVIGAAVRWSSENKFRSHIYVYINKSSRFISTSIQSSITIKLCFVGWIRHNIQDPSRKMQDNRFINEG